MTDKEEKSDLEKLKEKYGELKEKHGLPEFEDLNKDFHIERISEIETELLIREIRKFVAEKYSGYMRFVEAILNPVNSPMFVYSIIKLLGREEKELLEEMYKKFIDVEIELIELDIEFSEAQEATFVKKSFIEWQEMKKSIKKIIKTIKDNKDNKTEKNNNGYFS